MIKLTKKGYLAWVVVWDAILALHMYAFEVTREWCYHDRITKLAHFIPVKVYFTAEYYAKLYMREMGKLHGVPLSINSDVVPSSLLCFGSLSKRVLGNWDDHLSLIEFAFNNSYHSFIDMAQFEALYGRSDKPGSVDRTTDRRCGPWTDPRSVHGPSIVELNLPLSSKAGQGFAQEPSMVLECRQRPGCRLECKWWKVKRFFEEAWDIDSSQEAWLSMGSTTHIEKGKNEFAKDVHRLARLGIHLLDSNEGGVVVMNGAESPLVFEVKEKQYQDPIFLELKVNIQKQKLMDFEQGG
ncbi:hypothetical protein MTR67_006771 [Solanum verrucosum]|uniref:Uncharacterized protein n=1 Tax=Solanum verrucosum TaxID=315347 RepID=A0AAF0TC50_SOLVR|nr:hypothetical protein MTR67_006771 [Solanum verrucosum]